MICYKIFFQTRSACVLTIASTRLSSPFESLRMHLRHNGLWSGSIKMDIFRCEVNSVQSFDLYSD